MENYQIEQKINVYLDAGGIPPEVYIKQYDHNLRVIAAQVWDGAQPYALPAGYVARVGVRKSDGKRVLNDCETSADGPTLTVYAVITQQMTAVAGKQRAEIQISGPEGQLRSGSFVLDVVPAEVGEDVIESLDEYKSIDAILAEVRQLKAAADKDAQAAVQSAAAAKASETAAASNQSAAAGSATSAATSETAAQASAAAAASSATAAAGSANAAKASETAAAKSAADAAAAAERADGVHEINGKTGRVVTLTPADIGAATAAQGQISEGLIDGSQTAARAESAAAAAKLATARKIGSANFDGSENITLAQMGVPNPNLLDNSDFINPVNQRGQASYTGGYCIDRWVVSNCVYTVATRKLMLTPTGTARAAANMQQAILWKRYFAEGDIITVSAKVNGEVFSVSAVFPAPTGSAFPYAAVDISDEYELSLWRNTNQEHMSVVIQNKEGHSAQGTFTVDWIKLEKGSIATPYVPKGYTVELMECMRYFQIVGSQTIIPPTSANVTIGTGNVVDAATAVITIPISVPLRLVSPTVSMRGTFLLNWVNGSSTGNYSVSNISFQSATNTIVTIKAISQNMGLYFVRMQTAMSDSWIEISADL